MKNKDIYQTITNSWLSQSKNTSEDRRIERGSPKNNNTPVLNNKPVMNTQGFQFKNWSRESSKKGSKVSLIAESRKENTRYLVKKSEHDESIGVEKLADHIKDVEANIAKIKTKLEKLQKKP
jgi:hypothetical protein